MSSGTLRGCAAGGACCLRTVRFGEGPIGGFDTLASIFIKTIHDMAERCDTRPSPFGQANNDWRLTLPSAFICVNAPGSGTRLRRDKVFDYN
jgi:hypothetical protein